MSLINFLNPKLKPSVECDSVFEDGYSAGNLIADDESLSSNGFVAFSVVKPPVEIIFEFPKAIDLKIIKLWNSNGALRSTAFEIRTRNYDGVWERVAYVNDLDKSVDTLTFCDQMDYSRKSWKAADQQSKNVFFFRTAHKLLSNTSGLKIIIRGTQKCPPVLRKVEVWGFPARSLEKADRELVKTIWKEVLDNKHVHRTQQQQGGQRSPPRVPELNEYSKLIIPEEFLDAITWELMIFPTVLPSGKIVDQSTIDRHSEVEAKWGRLPSDPFTGLEFTSHRKAILNLALKARIEKFLLENSDHFKTVPRSLGSSRCRRSTNRHASQFASLCQNYTNTPGAYSILTRKSSETATLFSSTLPPKRAKLSNESSTISPSNTYRSQHLTTTATQTSATATASSSLSLTSSTPTSAVINVENAIQEALKKITRYTQVTPQEKKSDWCISCNSIEFAYQIQTCKHLVCRECMNDIKQKKVCICKISFRNEDVERYHKL